MPIDTFNNVEAGEGAGLCEIFIADWGMGFLFVMFANLYVYEWNEVACKVVGIDLLNEVSFWMVDRLLMCF